MALLGGFQRAVCRAELPLPTRGLCPHGRRLCKSLVVQGVGWEDTATSYINPCRQALRGGHDALHDTIRCRRPGPPAGKNFSEWFRAGPPRQTEKSACIASSRVISLMLRSDGF
jgi:hypothetical protein